MHVADKHWCLHCLKVVVNVFPKSTQNYSPCRFKAGYTHYWAGLMYQVDFGTTSLPDLLVIIAR